MHADKFRMQFLPAIVAVMAAVCSAFSTHCKIREEVMNNPLICHLAALVLSSTLRAERACKVSDQLIIAASVGGLMPI